MLLVTRDTDNTQITQEEITKFYEVTGSEGLKVIDYQRLFSMCREAADEMDLMVRITAMVNIDDRRFV